MFISVYNARGIYNVITTCSNKSSLELRVKINYKNLIENTEIRTNR